MMQGQQQYSTQTPRWPSSSRVPYRAADSWGGLRGVTRGALGTPREPEYALPLARA